MTIKANVFYYVTSKNYENEGLPFMSKVVLNFQSPDYLHVVRDNNGVTEYHYVNENDLKSADDLFIALNNNSNHTEIKESVDDLITALRDIRGIDIEDYVETEIERVEIAVGIK